MTDVNLAFAEKKTGAPIKGLKVQVRKNGSLHKATETDGSGFITTLRGFNTGDQIEVLVEKLTGGFKSLKTAIVQDTDMMLAFLSPKVKAEATTEVHKGSPVPRAVTPAPLLTDKPAFDSLDAIESIWQRMTSDLIGPATVNPTRNTKGHPNAVIKMPASAQEKLTVMPMQKTISGLLFPLKKKPAESYKTGARRFGSNRDKGTRKHAGIDLYAPVGTPVRAMADGVVIQSYVFYKGTHVLEVDHGTFIARYGEIVKNSIHVRKHEKITRGQVIGEVGKLDGMKISMLHLEMYATTEDPIELGKGLSQKKALPFQRRADLIDPTSSIDLSVME